MLLREFLEKDSGQGKRVLIVSDLARANASIRHYERETGKMIRGVSCMTLAQIADKIRLYAASETINFSAENDESPVEMLKPEKAMGLFMSVLMENLNQLSYYKDPKLLDLANVREILNKVNLVRAGGWKSDAAENSERLADLRNLASLYDERLKKEDAFDSIALLRAAIDSIASWQNQKLILSLLIASDISYLTDDTECLNGVQQTLLDKLKDIVGLQEVSLTEESYSIDSLSNLKDKASFYRGYSAFNEAAYIANDIFKHHYPFGTVSVLYTSSSQIPALQAALAGNEISMKILSSYLVSEDPYVSLVHRIKAWARDGFTEEQLAKILESPLLYVPYQPEQKDPNEKKNPNAISWKNSNDYFLQAKTRREDQFILGWGYQRNRAFIDHERNLTPAPDARRTRLLQLHESLLDIFSDCFCKNTDGTFVEQNAEPQTVFTKLYDFLKNNTKSTSRNVGLDGIQKLVDAVSYDTRELPLADILDLLDQITSILSMPDEEEANAVSVQSLDDWHVLERAHVYIIGLSLKDMQGDPVQSPVMTDEEMNTYLGNGYKPTLANRAKLREENLYRTLGTFHGETITFGYSFYDTQGFFESNPAPFYREALKQFGNGNEDEVCEFIYGNPKEQDYTLYASMTDTQTDTGTTDTSLKAEADDAKSQAALQVNTSASNMELLLNCPKQYAYKKLLHILENSIVSPQSGRWLDPAHKGTFFHRLMQQYAEQVLIIPVREEMTKEEAHTLLDTIGKQIEKDMLVEMPVAFLTLADRETEELIDAAEKYIERRLKGEDSELRRNGWRVLATEQWYQEAHYKIQSYSGTDYDFISCGSIDRIDYKLDANAKQVHFRIIDYKTGQKKNKEKEMNLGHLLQPLLYMSALETDGKIADDGESNEEKSAETVCTSLLAKISELEENPEITNWKPIVDSFQYEFPLDETAIREGTTEAEADDHTDSASLFIQNGQAGGHNITRLKCILTVIEGMKKYPDVRELYDQIAKYSDDTDKQKFPQEIEKLREALEVMKRDGTVIWDPAEIGGCRYCTYQDLCEGRKAGKF